MPWCWVKARATIRALCLSINPYICFLSLQTHLQLKRLTPRGHGTMTQVCVLWSASILAFMASRHVRSESAWLWEVGTRKSSLIRIIWNRSISVCLGKLLSYLGTCHIPLWWWKWSCQFNGVSRDTIFDSNRRWSGNVGIWDVIVMGLRHWCRYGNMGTCHSASLISDFVSID